MAKKQSSAGEQLLGAIGLIILLIGFLVSFFGSAVIIVMWLYYEFRATSLPIEPDFNYFSLTPEEENSLVSYMKSFNPLSAQYNNILDQGSNLSKRNDGYFSERSKLGKELNQKVWELEPQLDELESKINHYKNLPHTRINNWANMISSRAWMRTSILWYLLVVTFAIKYYSEIVVDAATFIPLYTLISSSEITPEMHIWKVITVLIAIMLGYATKYYKHEILTNSLIDGQVMHEVDSYFSRLKEIAR